MRWLYGWVLLCQLEGLSSLQLFYECECNRIYLHAGLISISRGIVSSH